MGLLYALHGLESGTWYTLKQKYEHTIYILLILKKYLVSSFSYPTMKWEPRKTLDTSLLASFFYRLGNFDTTQGVCRVAFPFSLLMVLPCDTTHSVISLQGSRIILL